MNDRGKGGFMQSIKGKILAMGGTALAASAILGVMGISAVNKNSNNNDVMAEINRISLYQSQNQSLDTTYLHFLETTYLDEILHNFDVMEESAGEAKKFAAAGNINQIAAIEESLKQCRENYAEIRNLSERRGFTPDTGIYQQFLAQDEELQAGIQKAVEGSSWLDGKWLMIENAAECVEVDGQCFLHAAYKNNLSWSSKRDWLFVRLGGSGVNYEGTVYLNNFVLHSAGGDKALDLSSLTRDEMMSSYRNGLKDLSLGKLGGTDTIIVDCKYNPPAPDTWMENIVRIPIKDYDVQNYTSISYDVYVTDGEFAGLQAGFSLADMYDFWGNISRANSMFSEYSKHVVEGSAEESEAEEIRGLFEEIDGNFGDYIVDRAQQRSLSELLSKKTAAFEEMTEQDAQIIRLKKENIILSDQLTQMTDEVRDYIERDTANTKSSLIIIIGVVLVISAAVLAFLTLFISRSINRNIRVFTDTLSEMTGGNLGVRAQIRSRDEFFVFSNYVNSFLERLSEVVFAAQSMSGSVKELGEELDGMVENSNRTSSEIGRAVNDISSSAATQVGETDSAAGQIRQMGSVYEDILINVEHLNDMSDKMHRISEESSQLMEELSVANQKTEEVFSQVVNQTYTTNESVQKIREVTDLITSIASQTNLLSLNATIEAARAGEAGRGFAVVATEIQKLADQSSQSAQVIKKIIDELAQEADMTVQIVDEVKGIVEQQQETLEQTKAHFAILDSDIADSGRETQEIRERTGTFDKARKEVENIITSLSSMSEENAVSSRETTASMTEFNKNIEQLMEYSGRLKEMANALENDLNFFHNFM